MVTLSHLIASLGLVSEAIGALLVAFEVVQQFKEKKFEIDQSLVFTKTSVEGQRINETMKYKKWEEAKYRLMKIGLVFLLLGLSLQLIAIWL